jgi:hypothetical protein
VPEEQVIKSPLFMANQHFHLVHLLHEFVNVFLAVSSITTFGEAGGLADETTSGRAQLECP